MSIHTGNNWKKLSFRERKLIGRQTKETSLSNNYIFYVSNVYLENNLKMNQRIKN